MGYSLSAILAWLGWKQLYVADRGRKHTDFILVGWHVECAAVGCIFRAAGTGEQVDFLWVLPFASNLIVSAVADIMIAKVLGKCYDTGTLRWKGACL